MKLRNCILVLILILSSYSFAQVKQLSTTSSLTTFQRVVFAEGLMWKFIRGDKGLEQKGGKSNSAKNQTYYVIELKVTNLAPTPVRIKLGKVHFIDPRKKRNEGTANGYTFVSFNKLVKNSKKIFRSDLEPEDTKKVFIYAPIKDHSRVPNNTILDFTFNFHITPYYKNEKGEKTKGKRKKCEIKNYNIPIPFPKPEEK